MFEKFRYSGISMYTCEDLKKKTKLYLYDPIKLKYFKNLKYLNKDIEIEFNYSDYDNVFEILKVLNKNYKKVSIYLNDKEKLNTILKKNNLENIDLDKVIIEKGLTLITLKDYMYVEKVLFNMIKPALSLSPLEKYIYAYNIVKKYKEYKECKKDKFYSRSLYRILFNNYIVCVGFSSLLNDLLTKLNINNKILDVMVDSEKIKDDYAPNHERIYVYLKDEKYGIDGYYLSDPTWDNNLKLDLYTYMLFTNQKNNFAKCFQYDDKFIIFNVNNIDDFYNKYEELKNRFYLKDNDIIEFILSMLDSLEPNYSKDLKNKYNEKKKKTTKLLLEELGNHIVSKVNNDIKEKNIWESIKVIYKKSYGYKSINDLNIELKKVKEYNQERSKECFSQNPDEKKLKKINYKESRYL